MEDRQILASGKDLIDEEVAFIAEEFRRGFEAVEQIDRPAVTVFGSARVREGDPAYLDAVVKETLRTWASDGSNGSPGPETET